MLRFVVLALLVVHGWTAPSLDTRMASVRTAQAKACLPPLVMTFFNVTLPVLAGVDDPTVYTAHMGLFVAHLTSNMAGGRGFCRAFATTCREMVLTWADAGHVPLTEDTYASHCRNVIGAMPEADLFLTLRPPFEDEIYLCLRTGMRVPSDIPWFT